MSDELPDTIDEKESNAGKADEQIPQNDFGVYLRDARQAAGLLTAEVASRLKLSEEIIKSLESSRIDMLPAPAFTQGYIKAYAKLLKISPDEIMRAYEVMVPNKVAALNFATALPAEHSSRDSAVKITSFVLVALAFVLVVFWIQQSGFELSGNLVKQNQVKDEPVVESVQSDLYPENMLSGEPVSMIATPSTGESQLQTQTVMTDAKKPVLVEKGIVNPAAVVNKTEPKPEIKPLPKPVVVSEKPVAAVEVKSEQKPAAMDSGDDVMKLRASADSWAEVQDADNNRLFYSLLKTGSTYAIKGRAPFRIFLGNAPSVSIEVNSQLVDISHYVRQNNIAHVKISARASTQSGGPRENLNQVIDQFVPETSGTNRID